MTAVLIRAVSNANAITAYGMLSAVLAMYETAVVPCSGVTGTSGSGSGSGPGPGGSGSTALYTAVKVLASLSCVESGVGSQPSKVNSSLVGAIVSHTLRASR